MRRTKIICTIGPRTSSRTAIERLAHAGMDVARLNFSYGTYETHRETIANIRAVAKKLERPIGILQDLSGPKLRVGDLPEGEIQLQPGAEIVLSTKRYPKPVHLPIPMPELPAVLVPGQRLLLSDGRIELIVLRTTRSEIHCKVRIGDLLQSHQGINVPDVVLPIRAVTRKDLADLKFGLEEGVDWVAMSFVREAADLAPLRRVMKAAGRSVALMAKIEKHEAVNHLEEIIAASDGIMVARGDLGIELPLDQVPVLQKKIIAACNAAGKPVVTATQMLESMTENPRPTRAEVSDIANAVFDGTDAIMLSGETATGRYPVEAVQVMTKVAVRAEAEFDFPGRLEQSFSAPAKTITDGISQATCSLAHDLEARAIIASTATGYSAFMVAKQRPEAIIVAVTPNSEVQQRLTLVWGVHPVIATRGHSTDDMIANAIARTREAGFIGPGDQVVITGGPGAPGRTNFIKVEVVK